MPLLQEHDSSGQATRHWKWLILICSVSLLRERDSSVGMCHWNRFVLICVPFLREHDSSVAASRCLRKWFTCIFYSQVPLEMMNLRATENDSSASACLYYENVIHLPLCATENDWSASVCPLPQELDSSAATWPWKSASAMCLYYKSVIHLERMPLKTIRLQHLCASITSTRFVCIYVPLLEMLIDLQH